MELTEQIRCLFEDRDSFARMSAAVEIERYEPVLFDFFKYPLGVSLIGVKKDQVRTVTEAFSVLFILDLFNQNEWIQNEAERTEPGQEVMEIPPVDEWEVLLRDVWINHYFELKYRTFNITVRDVNAFQRDLLQWLPANAPGGDAVRLKQELQSTRWVVSLFPDAFYDKYFGETDQYYFFAESGVYD